ncbi:hypothetical protein IE81DRAFT_105075 [Ceraceosorus guamensis]|uniref:Rhodanese domain-containing protein n=1 Tax=Ceraceosorus guamensis TaxID=1522189 RepID=A0A316VZM5_9BASI|nr:hypothetical protein IE81DRAFT_105075 [Ceraceosorus guamensis]PWN43117.1 hypothetical protein IE81DRAFT_105075 [Ceraceosorus guamensis]
MEISGSAASMPGHSQTGEGPSPAGSSSGSEDRSKLGVGESVARRLHTQRSGGRLRMDFLKPRKGFASGSGDTVAAARPSSTGYSGLPFSPTHASPTSAAYPSNMMAPMSFTGAMLSAGSSLPNAESDATSTTVAFDHGDRPGMYTESSLSASSTSVLGSSPRPSLPAIHTTFARSSAGSSQDLRLSNEPRRDSEGSSVAPSATLDQEASSAPPQTQNDQPADEGFPTSTTGPHSSHHAAHLWQLKNGLHSAISPLSSSASHTTYLPSAISDPHGLHSLHVAPRVPFAERAYANSFAHSAISDESVEDVSVEVLHPSVPPTPAGDVTWGSTQGGLTALAKSEDAARRAGLMGAAVRDGNIASNEHGRGIFGYAQPLHGRTRSRVTSTSVRSSIIPHELLWLRLQSCYGRGAFPSPSKPDSTRSRHANAPIPHEQMAPDATAIDARGSFATDSGTVRELSTAGRTTFSRLDRAADGPSRRALVSWDSTGLASQEDADLAIRQSERDAVFNASPDPADALGPRRQVASRTELSNAGQDGSWPVAVAHSLPVRLQHAPGVPRTATAPPSPPVQHAFETKDAGVTGEKEKDRYEVLSQTVEASSLDFSREQRADRDEHLASMPSFVKGERMTESSAASSPRSDLAAAAAEGAMQARAHAAAPPPPPPRHAGQGFRQGALDAPSRERASRQAAGAPMPSELEEQMERSDLTEHAHSAKTAETTLSHGNPSLGRRLQVRKLSAPQDLSLLSNSAVIAARAPDMRGETQATQQHSTCDLGADAALQHGTPSTAWSRDVLDSAPSSSRPRGDQYDRQSISASSPPAFVSTSTAPPSLYHSQHLDLASSDTASHAASHPSFASTSSFESRPSTDQRLTESEVLTSLTQPRSLFDKVSFDPCSRRPLLLLDARSLQAYSASRLKGSFHLDLKNRPFPRAVGKGAAAFIASILPDMAKRRFAETSFELDDTLPGPSSRPWPSNSEQEQRFWSATDVVLITDDAEDLASNPGPDPTLSGRSADCRHLFVGIGLLC